jgi:hypothetical protein
MHAYAFFSFDTSLRVRSRLRMKCQEAFVYQTHILECSEKEGEEEGGKPIFIRVSTLLERR